MDTPTKVSPGALRQTPDATPCSHSKKSFDPEKPHFNPVNNLTPPPSNHRVGSLIIPLHFPFALSRAKGEVVQHFLFLSLDTLRRAFGRPVLFIGLALCCDPRILGFTGWGGRGIRNGKLHRADYLCLVEFLARAFEE